MSFLVFLLTLLVVNLSVSLNDHIVLQLICHSTIDHLLTVDHLSELRAALRSRRSRVAVATVKKCACVMVLKIVTSGGSCGSKTNSQCQENEAGKDPSDEECRI